MLYKAFHHVAGSSSGTWSDFDSAIACIDFIKEVDDNPAYNEFYPDLAKYYRELAMDTQNQDSIDLDYFSDLVDSHCSDILPVSCSFVWEDGEFRITPFVDDCAESYTTGTLDSWEETNHGPHNPDQADFVYEVNDHGNVNCYEWVDRGNGLEWLLVWEMV